MRDHGKAIAVLLVLAIAGFLLSGHLFRQRVLNVPPAPLVQPGVTTPPIGPAPSPTAKASIPAAMAEYGYVKSSTQFSDIGALYVYCPSAADCADPLHDLTHPPLQVVDFGAGAPVLSMLYVYEPAAGSSGTAGFALTICTPPQGALWLADRADFELAWNEAAQVRNPPVSGATEPAVPELIPSGSVPGEDGFSTTVDGWTCQ